MRLCIVVAGVLLAVSLMTGAGWAGPPPAKTIQVMVEATDEDEGAYLLADKVAEVLRAQAKGRYTIVGSAMSRRLRPEYPQRRLGPLCKQDKICARLQTQVSLARAACASGKPDCESLPARLAKLAKAKKRVYGPQVASGNLGPTARACLSDERCLQDLDASLAAGHGLLLFYKGKGDQVQVKVKLLDLNAIKIEASYERKGRRADLDGLARSVAASLKL